MSQHRIAQPAGLCGEKKLKGKSLVKADSASPPNRRHVLLSGAVLLGAATQQAFSAPQQDSARGRCAGTSCGPAELAATWGTAVSRADDDDEKEVTYLDIVDLDRLTSAQEDILERSVRQEEMFGVPDDFPLFIREKFNVIVVGDAYKTDRSGLIYKDYQVGTGPVIREGDKVKYHYTGWLENGKPVGTSKAKQGTPIEAVVGKTDLVKGVEIGMKQMRNGGVRRMVLGPDLGPPTGPQSFFLPKQVQVFDIEILDVQKGKRD